MTQYSEALKSKMVQRMVGPTALSASGLARQVGIAQPTLSKWLRDAQGSIGAVKFDSPNEAWVGDITYIWTSEGWAYLAVIIDLFSRRVVGWAAGPSANVPEGATHSTHTIDGVRVALRSYAAQ